MNNMNNMNLANLKQFENELYLSLKKLKVNNASSCLKYIVRLLKTFKNQNDLESIFKEKLEFLLEKKTDEVIDVICNFFNIKRTYGLPSVKRTYGVPPVKRSPQKTEPVRKSMSTEDLENSNDARLTLNRACQQRLAQSKKLLGIRRREPERVVSSAVAHSRSGGVSRIKWNDIAGSIRSTNISRKLNIPCSTFLESGICMNGDTCKFTHGKAALVKPKVVHLNSIYNTGSGHVDSSCYILPNHDDRPSNHYGGGPVATATSHVKEVGARRPRGGPVCPETINISSGESRSSSGGSPYMRFSPPKVYEPPAILDSPLWYRELGLVVSTSASSCYSSTGYSRSRSRSRSNSLSCSRNYCRSPGGRQYPLRASSPSYSASSGGGGRHRHRQRAPSPESGRHRVRRHNCLLVTNIPSGINRIGIINKHFRKYGTLRNVEVRFKGDPRRALVEYRLNRDARVANSSTDAVMGNRFIKTRLYKKKKKRRSSDSGGGGGAGRSGRDRSGTNDRRDVKRSIRVKVKCNSSPRSHQPMSLLLPRKRSPSVALIEHHHGHDYCHSHNHRDQDDWKMRRSDRASRDQKRSGKPIATKVYSGTCSSARRLKRTVAKRRTSDHSRDGSLESGECLSASRGSSAQVSSGCVSSPPSENGGRRRRSHSNGSHGDRRKVVKMGHSDARRRSGHLDKPGCYDDGAGVGSESNSIEEVEAPSSPRPPIGTVQSPLKKEKSAASAGVLKRLSGPRPLPMDVDEDQEPVVPGNSLDEAPDVKLERALNDSDVESSGNEVDDNGDTSDTNVADRVARAQHQRRVVVDRRRDRLRNEQLTGPKNSMRSKLARVTDSMNHYKAVLEALIAEFKAATSKPRKAALVPQIKDNHARFMQLKKLRLAMLEHQREKALSKGNAVEGAISELHTFISEQLSVTVNRDHQLENAAPPAAPTPVTRVAPTTASTNHSGHGAGGVDRALVLLDVPTNVVLYREQVQSRIGTELEIESFEMIACSEIEVRYAVVMSCEAAANQAMLALIRDKPADWRVTMAGDGTVTVQ